MARPSSAPPNSTAVDQLGRTFTKLHSELGDAVETALVGKREAIDLALVALFAGGHLLLEDVPGTGKTTLAKSLASALGGTSGRVQFTPDLLPADITGTTVFNPADGEISFRPGPVFANVLLADEINRAAAKTQSALLEVMEERTVTVDGYGHSVPEPFLVIATQNPVDMDGTYRLPEAQLDRFGMRLTIGYPDADHEVQILRPGSFAGQVSEVPTVTDPETVQSLIRSLRQIHVADPLLQYVRSLGVACREDRRLRLGASTRALRMVISCAQVFAASRGRGFVVPGDIQQVLPAVLTHRLALTREAELSGESVSEVVADATRAVTVPQPTR